ncbi:serine/threonine-protein kinase pak-2-like [Asterias rubens]|uniref:serine/threonine-protein kinase pak-2-like n=1 Tax=Asterias rubens TaxID=7604 RepID=UPI001455552B|nr:serine/threonine-protein kinase pak-2-like [Asterias rubens]
MMQLLGKHPSFPAIYGVVIQDDHLALVTEFLGDELTSRPLSLTDALQGKRPLELSQGEWNDIAQDIVDGMWYMHQCSLLHHDIKTDNILLVESATRWEARIIDFGQCKQSKEQLVVPLHEKITPRWGMMAARLHWTTFSDIYSVGKILLLIGQHGNVPSLTEGGLSLKKSANLSKEPSDDEKYPQMEIVRFQLRNKSRKMWH